MPSGKPSRFSIIDVVPAWPPGATASTTTVRRPSDAALTAAARPAGPAPTIVRSYSDRIGPAGVDPLERVTVAAQEITDRVRAPGCARANQDHARRDRPGVIVEHRHRRDPIAHGCDGASEATGGAQRPGAAGIPGHRTRSRLASACAVVIPPGAGGGVRFWPSGPGRSRAPAMTAPNAKMPAVHQNAVS